MITVSDTRIMIVPDFGGSADDEAMVALKKAIEDAGSYAVKVVDLPAVVRAEHDGEELSDAKVIELSARKLEQLASCDELIWDGTNSIELRNSRTVDEEKFYLCREGDELFVVDENDIDFYLEEYNYQLEEEAIDYDWGAPDVVVVLGKSAMLAGGLGEKNVLFVNPEYDSEWPWKKQYYADQKLAGQYHCDKYEYERGFMETVIWMGGSELTRPWRYSRRYGLITSADYIGEFWERYPGMAEVDRALDGDTDALAKFICDFADDKLTFPLEEVDEAISAPAKKRILIVPDYFMPYNAPNVKELYERLRQRGYYVAVYIHGESLEKSRAGIERRCKVKPFDLIVTLETGCLVAGSVANCPRIMVNPDWVAWEWMRLHLGEDKERVECRGINNSGPFYTFYLNSGEVAMARHMAERSYFKRSDKPVYGWFTVDAVESHLPEEHLKRFNTSAYIPGLRLDTEEGIDILARQIDNILTIDDNE